MQNNLRTKPKAKPTFELIDSATFDELDCDHEWLVNDVLVEGQPGVIGGPKKTLKTSVMVDLAISLGTGTKFLDRFPVPHVRKVAVFSGESGMATLKSTAKRVCGAKKVRLEDAGVHWEFKLPRFSRVEDRKALRTALRKAKIEVIFIDPLYLCLGAGAGSISASNLYEVGPALFKMAQTCLDVGATPIVVHHATKAAAKSPKSGARPLDLDDLAFAGIGEFTRQWILINRHEVYQPGTGMHSLLMSVGGSAGHSSCWSLQVDEGKLHEGRGRHWKVRVRAAEVKEESHWEYGVHG